MPGGAHDIAIIGGGLVGLATAAAIRRRSPDLKMVVLEKERALAQHQSSHNTGVIHCGAYYKPGSLKARLCVEGARRMKDFCQERGIPFRTVGQVTVALDESEAPRVDELHARAVANGVPGVEKIGRERLREIEPRAAGLCAVHAPGTAIVQYPLVAEALGRQLRQSGVDLQLFSRVVAIDRRGGALLIRTRETELSARYLINCGGLYCDAIARMMGLRPGIQIVPLRGDYYVLRPERRAGIHGLIYPVPDPRFPLLGVHFTPKMSGEVVAGPNAVVAFAREGYSLSRVHPAELARMLSFPGFWWMVRRYWRTGMGELWQSISKAAFVRSMQRLIPDLTAADALRGGSGVRAQAVNARGDLLDDFSIVEAQDALHVLNAPSPAATSSLAIGEYIAERVPR